MVKQQIAKAVSYPLYWGLLLFIPLIINKAVRKTLGVPKGKGIFPFLEESNADDGIMGYGIICGAVIPCLLLLIFGLGFVYWLSEGIMIAMNPEYYALKDIIGMLR